MAYTLQSILSRPDKFIDRAFNHLWDNSKPGDIHDQAGKAMRDLGLEDNTTEYPKIVKVYVLWQYLQTGSLESRLKTEIKDRLRPGLWKSTPFHKNTAKPN